MGPVEAIRTCFAKYADFSGRASRPEFWWFTLFGILLGFLLMGLEVALGFDPLAEPGEGVPVSYILQELRIAPLNTLGSLALFCPSLAVTARRLHDRGGSGWLQAIPIGALLILWTLDLLMALSAPLAAALGYVHIAVTLGAIASAVWLFVQLASRSHPAPNRYGPPPLASGQAAP
ncbi:MAG: DUF805 domain-containing protein [Pseudomonadota bacterium]